MQLKNPELLIRPVVVDLLTLVKQRIHIDGKDSNDQQIGTYDPGYMKLRTDKLPDKYTKGKNKGLPRPKYNRKEDTKIIISLTTKLENDWAVIETSNGKGYGLGFLTETSLNKLRWIEEGKKKKIGELTEKELDFAEKQFQKYVEKVLSK